MPWWQLAQMLLRRLSERLFHLGFNHASLSAGRAVRFEFEIRVDITEHRFIFMKLHMNIRENQIESGKIRFAFSRFDAVRFGFREFPFAKVGPRSFLIS